jgi:hypothetical protein
MNNRLQLVQAASYLLSEARRVHVKSKLTNDKAPRKESDAKFTLALRMMVIACAKRIRRPSKTSAK